MFKKENIGIIVSVIAIIIAIGGYSYPIAQDINAALGAFDIPTRFPNGHLDTNGGYYVDGTAIINGSGALSATTGTFSGIVKSDAGIYESYTNSTSTTATTQTLVAADILNYSTILMVPNTGSVTFTFPASSTLSAMVPAAGDRFKQCWVNSTTTASTNIVFAAGSGIDLKVATSTGSSGGAMDLTIGTGDMGCLEYVRKKATATTFDIIVALTEFGSAD